MRLYQSPLLSNVCATAWLKQGYEMACCPEGSLLKKPYWAFEGNTPRNLMKTSVLLHRYVVMNDINPFVVQLYVQLSKL